MKAEGKTGRSFPLFVCLSVVLLIFAVNLKSVIAALEDSDFYYYSSGHKIALPVSKETVAVRFGREVTLEEQRGILQSEENIAPFFEARQVTIFNVTVVPLREGITEEDITQTITGLNSNSEVEFASPVFDLPAANLIVTDEFNAKFAASVSLAEIQAFNVLYNVEIIDGPLSASPPAGAIRGSATAMPMA